ncbi:MAG: complex I NDUFA9 subunit family protein [Proteobacteria bacterium]|nr:complex I NDUFA9 subunit family protein [Pseudomonadota bacterium]
MAQRLITVFGGSGFLGRYVVRRLAERGDRVRVAVRRPNLGLFLKPMGDVGQIELRAANVLYTESIENAVAGADAVVNLVGVLSEFRRQRFGAIHAAGARRIAEASADAGARTLTHVSAIGADPQAASKYARSKGEGELAVKDAFPAATIFRPSLLIGPEDDFFNRFARLSKLSPALPIVGGKTRFQPVCVDDVAAAIVQAVDGGKNVAGKTFELGGPEIWTLRQLLEIMMSYTGVKRPIIDLPPVLAAIPAALTGWLPNPPITLDQIRMLRRDNVVGEGAAGFEKLGLTPSPIQVVLPTYLARYHAKGRPPQPRSGV